MSKLSGRYQGISTSATFAGFGAADRTVPEALSCVADAATPSDGGRVERATETFAVPVPLVVGFSHLLQPYAGVELFVALRR